MTDNLREYEMSEKEKLSKVWATMIQLEESARIIHLQMEELKNFKMAQRPKNIVYLVISQMGEIDSDINYMRDTLNS